jgi:hypothetical protein
VLAYYLGGIIYPAACFLYGGLYVWCLRCSLNAEALMK